MTDSVHTLIPASALALMPCVVTKREIIRGVPERYQQQYPNREKTVFAGKVGDIRDRLDALDLECASEADVAQIIGNLSWTRLECDICGQDRPAVVRVHKEYDGPTDVCGFCAEAVLAMLSAQGMSAGTAKTAQPVEGEARQPGPQDAPETPSTPPTKEHTQ